MTAILPSPAPKPAPKAGRSAQQPASARRTLDCEICVVGDDLVARALAWRLAAQGREVVRVTLPADEMLPLDGVLAPGFALPALDLVERIGDADAAELWFLSRDAATRGRELVEDFGITAAKKGALKVARATAARGLAAEQEAMARIAPGASRPIGAQDLEGLLGTRAFVAAIGLVPAVRVNAGELGIGLGAAGVEAGVYEIAASVAIGCDLHGLRKYVDVGTVRVRAFEVVMCGSAALRCGAPDLAGGLAATHWVTGRSAPLAEESAFTGDVAEFGGLGLRYQADETGLALAAETAWPVRTAWGAGRVLTRHAGAVLSGAAAARWDEARSLVLAAPRHLMPLAGSLAKGIWVAGGLAPQPLSVHLLTADLIGDAIMVHDDRIALLSPFLHSEARRTFGWVGDLVDYGRRRFAARLAPAAKPPSPDPVARPPEGEAFTGTRGPQPQKAREGARMAVGPGGANAARGSIHPDARQRP